MRSGPLGPIWDLELVVSGDDGVELAQAQTPGRRIHLTLGPYPDLSLASARELADWHLEQVRQAIRLERTSEPQPAPAHSL